MTLKKQKSEVEMQVSHSALCWPSNLSILVAFAVFRGMVSRCLSLNVVTRRGGFDLCIA